MNRYMIKIKKIGKMGVFFNENRHDAGEKLLIFAYYIIWMQV